jgi:hypothetical protein
MMDTETWLVLEYELPDDDSVHETKYDSYAEAMHFVHTTHTVTYRLTLISSTILTCVE